MLLSVAMLSLSALPASAGGVDHKTIAADAKWVVHVDVEAAVASKVGQFILNKARELGVPVDQKLAEVKEKVGFDPLADIKGVTIYGADYDELAPVLLVRAKVDREKVLGLLQASETYKEIQLAEHVVHHWVDPKAAERGRPAERYGAFHGEDLVVIANTQQRLTEALKVLDGDSKNVTADEKLARAFAPAKGTLLFVSARDVVQKRELPAARSLILKRIRHVVIEVGTDDDEVTLAAAITVRDQKQAERLARLINGFVALAELKAEMNEAEGAEPEIPPHALELLASVRAEAAEGRVKLTAAVSTETLIKVIGERMAEKAELEGAGE
jgi:hypothetical protein